MLSFCNVYRHQLLRYILCPYVSFFFESGVPKQWPFMLVQQKYRASISRMSRGVGLMRGHPCLNHQVEFPQRLQTSVAQVSLLSVQLYSPTYYCSCGTSRCDRKVAHPLLLSDGLHIRVSDRDHRVLGGRATFPRARRRGGRCFRRLEVHTQGLDRNPQVRQGRVQVCVFAMTWAGPLRMSQASKCFLFFPMRTFMHFSRVVSSERGPDYKNTASCGSDACFVHAHLNHNGLSMCE